MTGTATLVGELLRDWRRRRRLSQTDLACDTEISPRQLALIETGRSRPERDTLMRMAERLDVPLRDRNVLLAAGGFPPAFGERTLANPEMTAAREAVECVLVAQEPNPALAIDRHWTMLAANAPLRLLVAGADAMLMRPPVNVLRLCLHPAGLASRIANLPEWRAHVVVRLRRQIRASGDPVLTDLLEEIQDYPMPNRPGWREPADGEELAMVPFRLITIDGTLSFFNATTVFGGPRDITLAELVIESFVPADIQTAAMMRRMVDGSVPVVGALPLFANA